MSHLSILNIIHDTTVDGVGFRTAIYGAGCVHQCKGCHNPHSWNKTNGQKYSVNELFEIIQQDEFSNVTFSGGDPLVQVKGFTELAKLIKENTNKTIWCYTGFTFEEIIASNHLSQILPYLDVLVDGKYDETSRDVDLKFRGSHNQRIVDVKKTLSESKVTLLT